jgi:hypothetical protein
MARDLTAGMVTEVASTTVRPIVLVKLEFDSGAVRVWNGIGDLSWNAQTWTGVGDLGGVSPVEEAGDLKASGVRFQLSGIPAALISTALSEDYQDRPARMWLGMLDENLNIVADPYPIFRGRMDVMDIQEGGETATIGVTAENVLASLERARETRYTAEDQKLEFPGDKGLDFVPSLQEAVITWGN